MNILAPGTATDAIEVGRHPFKILLDLSLVDFIAQMSGFAQLLSDLVKSPGHGSSRSDEQPVDSIPETIENRLSHDRLRLDDDWCCAPFFEGGQFPQTRLLEAGGDAVRTPSEPTGACYCVLDIRCLTIKIEEPHHFCGWGGNMPGPAGQHTLILQQDLRYVTEPHDIPAARLPALQRLQ